MGSHPQSTEVYSISPQEDQLEPIAVVGVALKFPQDATSPAGFWKMMEEKRCAMTEWPSDRINLNAFYHTDNERRDTVLSRISLAKFKSFPYIDPSLMLNSFRREEATFYRKTWQPLMLRSFRSPLKKRCQWIHSSGCSWRLHTERLRMVRNSRTIRGFLC